MGSQSYLPPGRGSIFHSSPDHCYGWYLIYPPVRNERLSRPEPMQANELPRIAKEVPVIPGVSRLSLPSAPLGTIGVNN